MKYFRSERDLDLMVKVKGAKIEQKMHLMRKRIQPNEGFYRQTHFECVAGHLG